VVVLFQSKEFQEYKLFDDKLLKIGDCLEIIPMAKSTFWQKVKDGTLAQPFKIGASTFWKASDLQAFIANMPVSDQSRAPAGV
jgi:predicted DNA-binding transcriptional regulator AlpA